MRGKYFHVAESLIKAKFMMDKETVRHKMATRTRYKPVLLEGKSKAKTADANNPNLVRPKAEYSENGMNDCMATCQRWACRHHARNVDLPIKTCAGNGAKAILLPVKITCLASAVSLSTSRFNLDRPPLAFRVSRLIAIVAPLARFSFPQTASREKYPGRSELVIREIRAAGIFPES